MLPPPLLASDVAPSLPLLLLSPELLLAGAWLPPPCSERAAPCTPTCLLTDMTAHEKAGNLGVHGMLGCTDGLCHFLLSTLHPLRIRRVMAHWTSSFSMDASAQTAEKHFPSCAPAG